MQHDSAEIMEIFSSIQGEGILVGERQLFIRFYGCNLSCAYCDTDASRGKSGVCRVERTSGQGDFFTRPNPLSAGEVAELIRERLRPASLYHSLALTGGEPLLQRRFLASFLPEIHSGIPVYLETNGTLPDALASVLKDLDWIAMDVKLASATGQATDWEAHRWFLRTGKEKLLCVKSVVTRKTSEGELRLLADLISEVDPAIPLILQPASESIGDAEWGGTLLAFQKILKEDLRTVRVIPQIHNLLKII